MNKKENYIKIPLHRLQDMRVALSRMYRDGTANTKDIELLLFYIYQDWDKVEETIEKWEQEK